MDWNAYRYSSTGENAFWFPDSDEPEREVHKREVADFGVADAEGRTIVARIVPYNKPTLVADAPGLEPYMEMFMPGAFQAQTRAPNRVDVAAPKDMESPVFLNYGHDPSLRGIIGRGIALYDRDDHLYGEFLVHDDEDGNKALRFVRERLLRKMSLEFVSLKSRVVDGVVQRLKVKMPAVALVREGAYPSAQVMALRHAQAMRLPRPDPLDPDLVKSLEHFGIRVPRDTSDPA